MLNRIEKRRAIVAGLLLALLPAMGRAATASVICSGSLTYPYMLDTHTAVHIVSCSTATSPSGVTYYVRAALDQAPTSGSTSFTGTIQVSGDGANYQTVTPGGSAVVLSTSNSGWPTSGSPITVYVKVTVSGQSQGTYTGGNIVVSMDSL